MFKPKIYRVKIIMEKNIAKIIIKEKKKQN